MKKAVLPLFLVFSCIASSPAQQELVDSLKKILPTVTEDTTRVVMLGDIAFYLYNLDPVESFEYGKQTLELAKKINFGRGIINGYYKMCIARFGASDYMDAEKYALLALEQAEKMNYTQKKSPIFNILGIISKHQGNYHEAIKWGFESEKIARESNDMTDVGVALTNIGVLYLELNDTTIAKKYFLDALEIMEEKQEKQHLVELYTNLEPVEQDTGKRFYYINRAIDLAEQANYPNPLAYNYNNLANFYLEIRKDNNNAYKSYRKALYYLDLTGDNYQKSITCVDLGDYFLQNGELDSARYYLNQGLALATDSNIRLQKVEANRSIAKIQAFKGDFEHAYQSLMDSYILNDSLYNENIAHQLAIANTRFETEKKEAQIAQQGLELATQENIRNRIIFAFVSIILITIGIFQWYYNRQRRKKKEAELALELKQTETENLRKLDSMKSNFFTNISHELRTPLTLISGPLENAIEKTREASVADDIKLAHSNSKKLLVLINEILDLSKLEGGKLEVKKSPVNYIQLVKRIFYSFQSLANLRKINLVFNSDLPENLTVQMDIEKFEKILNNLISNAIKYSGQEKNITLETKKTESRLTLKVIDEGSGIHPEDLPNIFNRFYQSSDPAQSMHGGTGVGLALARQLCLLLGGDIEVESQVARGSTFTVDLPLIISENKVPETGSEYQKGEVEDQEAITYKPIFIDGEKARILIVEDNPEMSNYLEKIMSPFYHCETAQDGMEALKKIQKEKYDLITSDVMMPRMDGFEFRDRVNKLPTQRQIPFIMLTARAMEEDKVFGLSLGVDDYITKPFKATELLARINNLLRNKIERESWIRDNQQISTVKGSEESAEKQILKKAEQSVLQNLSEPGFKVADLAKNVGYGERQLRRVIKKLTGLSPVNFILEIRLYKAYQLLDKRVYLSVSEVRYEVGIESASYFTKKFRERFGRNPNEMLD